MHDILANVEATLIPIITAAIAGLVGRLLHKATHFVEAHAKLVESKMGTLSQEEKK
jgi:hypothetical protein